MYYRDFQRGWSKGNSVLSFLCIMTYVPVSVLNVPNNWKKMTNSLKTESQIWEWYKSADFSALNSQPCLLFWKTWIDYILFYKDLHTPELKRSQAKTRATFIGNLLQNNPWWAEKKVEGLNASERICLPKKPQRQQQSLSRRKGFHALLTLSVTSF